MRGKFCGSLDVMENIHGFCSICIESIGIAQSICDVVIHRKSTKTAKLFSPIVFVLCNNSKDIKDIFNNSFVIRRKMKAADLDRHPINNPTYDLSLRSIAGISKPSTLLVYMCTFTCMQSSDHC